MNGLRAVLALVVGWLVLGLSGAAHALPVANGLVAWYDANDIDGNPLTANPANGTAVGTWVNKANPGTNNGTATGTTPTLRSAPGDLMNGDSVIRFTAASGTGYNIGTFRTSAGGVNYFGVTKSTVTSGTWQRLISSYDNGQTAGTDYQGENWCLVRPLSESDGTARAYPSPYSGAVSQYSNTGKSMENMRLGRNAQSGSDLLNADMAEVLLYDRQLNMAERIITQNYLMAKYNGTNYWAGSPPTVQPPLNDFYAGDDAARGNYDLHVFGVGQQVGAANQLLISTTSTNPLFANAGLILEVTGGLGDNEYLLAGHKTAVNSGVTTDLPDAVLERW
ncbi:MAG TPA: hypothetical protein VNE39_24270, partial [Planctomycetota bacterium]|nr:hypothetical protein [Planctomycetota bacterium]